MSSQYLGVSFVHQGHLVKVKVTGVSFVSCSPVICLRLKAKFVYHFYQIFFAKICFTSKCTSLYTVLLQVMVTLKDSDKYGQCLKYFKSCDKSSARLAVNIDVGALIDMRR